MALKAGYQGLKKAFKQSIESFMANMSDALIIKSLDDALSLSDDGELSVDDASTSGKGIVQLDTVPTEDSGNAITSGGVYGALQDIGFDVKKITYTGDGQSSKQFTFSEKPSLILGIYGEIDSRGYYNLTQGFPYGSYVAQTIWRKAGTNPGSGCVSVEYDNADDKKMTISGGDSGQICNYTDGTYYLFYI